MIQPIHIAVLIFAVFHVINILFLWRKRKIAVKAALFWLAAWAAILVILFATPAIDALSKPVGVGRGIDLVVYSAILVLFYIIFKLTMKIDKLEGDISKLVRSIALRK